MRYLLIVFFAIIFYSCSDTGPNEPIYEITQFFYVENKDGNDLLDQDNPNSIDIDKIKVFYIIDGKKMIASEYWKQKNQDVYDNSIDNGYRIVRNSTDKKNMLILTLSEVPLKDNITDTLLEWDENDTDTIKSKIIKKEPFETIVRMVEYNNIQVEKDEQFFTIVK